MLTKPERFVVLNAVRALTPDLPSTIGNAGHGMPDLLDYSIPNDADNYRTVSFGDTYDGEPYVNATGDSIVGQVWFTDSEGSIDIIELTTFCPIVAARAVRTLVARHDGNGGA